MSQSLCDCAEAGHWKEGADGIVVDPSRIGNALRLINDYIGVVEEPNATMVEVRACMRGVHHCCCACRYSWQPKAGRTELIA